LTSKTEQFYIQRIAALEKQVTELNSRKTPLIPQNRHRRILSNRRERKKPTHPAIGAANPDIPSTKDRPLRPKKSIHFKHILLMSALIAAVNLKRLRAREKLFSRLKSLKSQFTLNNTMLFATGANIVRSFITLRCQPTLRKAN